MATVHRVYRFGCKPPFELALAHQLLGQAWLYRDELRRIYNEHRRSLERLFLAEGIDSAHVAAWENEWARTDDAAHVVQFRRRAAKSELHDELNRAICHARKPECRGHLLDAGTYWLVEAEAKQAHERATQGGNPFRPLRIDDFRLDGRIGAEIQSRKQFPADAWPTRGRVRLSTEDEFLFQGKRPWRRLTIAVGELKDQRTITWRIRLHRPFPAGSIVKKVAVQAVRSGPHTHWEALVTVDLADPSLVRDPDAYGTVGIDIGWRRETPTTQRVATHDGSDGRTGVLVIDTLDSFEYADAVESIRDHVFNDAKAWAAKEKLAPHVGQWLNKDRLHQLHAKLPENLGLAMWHVRDRHLHAIAAGVRSRAQRRRLDAYRRYADQLAKQYRFVALEDMPMSAWVGQSERSEDERKRSTAALYLLQCVISERFGPARTDWIPPDYSSRTCGACFEVHPVNLGPQAEWVCASCGVVHHQDENAAFILRLRSEGERGDGRGVRARSRKALKTKKKNAKVKSPAGGTVSVGEGARNSIANAAE